MISIANADSHSDLFQNYSWNNADKNLSNEVYISMIHSYTDRCYLLTPFKPYLLTLASVYFVVAVVWCVFTFYLWKIQNFMLQKWLALIPIFKALWLLQLSLEYYTCPWDS